MMQKRYDAETDHSKKIDAQQRWQLFIKKELDKLSKFKLIE
ncbi:hypothetical protein JCM19300_4486 [Algibacter lectus]|nr:hypothetical protein JCM19300_4486 [Algibacter lectus]